MNLKFENGEHNINKETVCGLALVVEIHYIYKKIRKQCNQNYEYVLDGRT